MKKPYCDFAIIPFELLVEILQFVKFEDQIKVSRCSTLWKKALKEVDVRIYGGYQTRLAGLDSTRLLNIIQTLMNPDRVLILENIDIGDEILNFPNLRVLKQKKYGEEVTGEFLEKLSKACPLITTLGFHNPYSTDFEPLWSGYPALKHLEIKNDECDIEIDEMTNDSLKVFAESCNGDLETLVIQGMTWNLDHNGLTPLIKKCPKLKKVDLTYNYTIYTEVDHTLYSKEMLERLFSIQSLEKVRLTRNFFQELEKTLDKSLQDSITRTFHRKVTTKHREKIVFTKK